MLRDDVIVYLKNLAMLLSKKQKANFSIEREMHISIINNCVLTLKDLQRENRDTRKRRTKWSLE